MTLRSDFHYAAEDAHHHVLAAARRAIRAGDLVRAERWMRLAERHYRCNEMAMRQAHDWRCFLNDRKQWREARDAKNRAQVAAIRAEDARRAARTGPKDG